MTTQTILVQNDATDNSVNAAADSVFHSTERIRKANEIIHDVMDELSLCILGMKNNSENRAELVEIHAKLEQSLSLTGAANEILTVHGLTYGPQYKEAQAQERTGCSIQMDEVRGRRFHWALSDVFEALYSLCSMPKLFPGCDPQPGEIDPHYAVRSFSMVAEPILLLMLDMLAGEEHLNEHANVPERLRAPAAPEPDSADE